MANGYTQGGRVAAYPTSGYPVMSFRGAGSLRGGAVGASGGSPVAAVTGAMPAAIRGNSYLVFGVVLVGAWLLWHYTSGR